MTVSREHPECGLIRALALAAFAAAFPATGCENLIIGDASQPSRYSQKYLGVLAAATKVRFAAAADAGRCLGQPSLYSFDKLRDKLPEVGQAMLDDAAAACVAEGRSVANATSVTFCGPAIAKLSEADDRLLVLSEHIPSEH